jgi:geranylgeranyl pyrophosphate synthase
LIHDDLPCLDNDSLRRGEPTCHVKFGEPVALLAGDYLIAKAQGIISNSSNISDQSKVALLKLIGDATEDLCVGQVMDIEAKDLKCASIEESLQILRQRHLKKTAALISASTVCAALINNQKADIVAKFKNFGENLGLLFQITDDILDVVSSAEVLGKNPLRDAARGTPTYVSVHGLDGAKDLAKQVAAEAKASIYDFGEKSIFLTQFTDFVLTRTK